MNDWLHTYDSDGDFAVRLNDIESISSYNKSNQTRIQLKSGRVFWSNERLSILLNNVKRANDDQMHV